MKARISVVVPCFNHGRFLREALDSIHAQTLLPAEVVVVDDGSDDPLTLRVLAELSTERTRVLRLAHNSGAPAARNAGLREATGNRICSMDADDCLGRRWLEEASAALDADPGLAFVSHWLEAFGDEGWHWTPERCDLAAVLDACTLNGPSLIRREALESIGGFPEGLAFGYEDWDRWLQLLRAGHRGSILPAAHYRYRRHAATMTARMDRHRAFSELVAGHREAYSEHVIALIGRREAAIADALRSLIDPDEAASSESTLERRRAEGATLRERVAAELLPEYSVCELEAQVRAIEHSWSWRLTAPLRWACDLVRSGS